MKLNEKNLIAFAVSPTPVDKEGWLNKRGEVNKGFQKRWFVLKGNLLFYFEKKGDKEPVGVIILEGCTIELAEFEDYFSFKIVFHGPGNRSYILAADTHDVMEQWMKALACASHDYMKLMVADLQRQLEELEDNVPVTRNPFINSNNHQMGSASPQPPPRIRQNPFNKPASSHNLRPSTTNGSPSVPRSKLTFRELHNMYGRPILINHNEWRHRHKLNLEKLNSNPLISFGFTGNTAEMQRFIPQYKHAGVYCSWAPVILGWQIEEQSVNLSAIYRSSEATSFQTAPI